MQLQKGRAGKDHFLQTFANFIDEETDIEGESDSPSFKQPVHRAGVLGMEVTGKAELEGKPEWDLVTGSNIGGKGGDSSPALSWSPAQARP